MNWPALTNSAERVRIAEFLDASDASHMVDAAAFGGHACSAMDAPIRFLKLSAEAGVSLGAEVSRTQTLSVLFSDSFIHAETDDSRVETFGASQYT